MQNYESNLSEQITPLKIVVLGQFNIGKTCLITKYINNSFQEHYIPTIGVDFNSKIIIKENQQFKLQIWDIVYSQSSFRKLTSAYYRQSKCIIFVYDITSRESFKSASDHINEICRDVTTREAIFILVGQKCDLSDQREVAYDEGKQLALSCGMVFVETSAKSSHNVELLFNKIVDELFEKK